MACETCRDDWLAQRGDARALTFDVAHPDCECEAVNVSADGPPVANAELLARLIVSPQEWHAGDSALIWLRLRMAWRAGLSFFRPGTHPEEVRQRVKALTEGGAETQTLVGALLTTGGDIRTLEADGGGRLYCVYDTDAEEFSRHADAIGRQSLAPIGVSKSQLEKFTATASKRLREELEKKIVRAETADELIEALRAEGFGFVD